MTSLAVRSRRELERRLRRLRNEHGTFPLERRTVENDPDFFEEGRELIEAGAVGAAGALVTDDDGRVLLCRHPEVDAWGPPGGGHEPGETLAATARREVREEAGVEIRFTGVRLAIRKRFVHADDPERRGYLLEVVFDAEHVAGAPDASDDDEILAADWFADPPEAVVERFDLG